MSNPQHLPPQPSQPWPATTSAPPQVGAAAPQYGYTAPPPGAPGYGYPGGPGRPVPLPIAPSGQPLAEFTDRLLARLIDGLIIGAVSMVFAIPAVIAMFAIMGNSLEVNSDGTLADPNPFAFLLPMLGIEAGIFVLAFLFTYLYEVEYVLRNEGRSVGKRAMKIQIVPIAPGAPLTRPAMAKRWLCHNVGGAIIPAFSWIDGLWQLWDQPYKQCLHDKFAQTVVVKNPNAMAMVPKGTA